MNIIAGLESEECIKSELDLFSTPPTQTAIEDGIWDTILPHPNFRDSSTIRFDIPGTSANYLDLSQTELHCEIQCLTANNAGYNATDKKKISVVNNLLHSLFKQIKVLMNNSPVENTNDTYAYRAYMENLLLYSKEAKNSFLRAENWIKDNEHMNYIGANDDTKVNTGFDFRSNLLSEKKSQHLVGKLHLDVFNINRLMLNNLNIQLLFSRSDPKFYLMGSLDSIGDFKIYINNIYLKIRRVSVSPSVMYAHTLALEKTTAKYPLKRVVLKALTVPYNSTKFSLVGIHSGVMPTRAVFGFLDTSANDGAYTSNPFEFKHFNIKEINLKIASKSVPYSTPLTFDFVNDDYMNGYTGMFKNIREAPNDISYEDYKNGNTLFAFDLSPDLCSSSHYSLTKDGSLDLDVLLATPQNSSITVIAYLEFDNVLEINDKRHIIFDYKI